MGRAGIVTVKGDFTMLKFIATLGRRDLEKTVGYEEGRLESGFLIIVLDRSETLHIDEFELKASTRFSGGVLRKDSLQPCTIEDILIEREQNIENLKVKVAQFFSRRGGNTPAKVLPNLRHTEGMQYPDAEALGPGIRSGVPQFNLMVPKRFIIVREEQKCNTSHA